MKQKTYNAIRSIGLRLKKIVGPKIYNILRKAPMYFINRPKRVPAMSNKELESDRAMYERLNTDTRFKLGREHDYICRFDKYAPNGQLDNQYFIQDIWGARKVCENKPSVHYDVGSSVAGFIAHLLAMRQKIVLIDIREMNNDFDTPFLNGDKKANQELLMANNIGGGGGKMLLAQQATH